VKVNPETRHVIVPGESYSRNTSCDCTW